MKNTEKKVYTAPSAELLKMDAEDILTSSPASFDGIALPLGEDNEG